MKFPEGLEQAKWLNLPVEERYEKSQAYAQYLPSPGLFHFTHLDNLSSIGKHGLLAHGSLRDLGENPLRVDTRQISSNELGISLSVGHPNSRMMYQKFGNFGDKHDAGNLVVLKLAFTLLCSLKFFAFPSNSKRFEGLSLDQLRQFYDFTGYSTLFQEGRPYGRPNEWISRRELGIHDFLPTDPQAELIVLDNIPNNFVREVWVSRKFIERYNVESVKTLIAYFPQADMHIVESQSLRWNREDKDYWVSKDRSIDWRTLKRVEGGDSCGCQSCFYPI
jgi:hypothetical protein